MATHDYYETLQVHPKADGAAIEAAYHRLLDLYDPGRLQGAADELVELARQKRAAVDQAYAVLGDPARRAAYDSGRSGNGAVAGTKDERPKTKDQSPGEGSPPSSVLRPPSSVDTALDYRPLPPAGRSERPRSFDAQPTLAGRGTQVRAGMAALVVAAAVVLPALLAGLLLTGGGAPARPAATATPSPADMFEQMIAQAKAATEQNPGDAQAWVEYGHLLYDSAQVVREQAPDSVMYQQRLPRWLEAREAYKQALAIGPANPAVQADMGASGCFYGAGSGDLKYVEQGLAETKAALDAAPRDPRVLISRGYCLVSTQPPQTAEALEMWRGALALVPDDSPVAAQAKLLIERYAQQ